MDDTVLGQWTLRRNCALTPAQLAAATAPLLLLLAGVSIAFWTLEARWIAAFAALEAVGLAAALRSYAAHATDRELLQLLTDGRLVVDRHDGSRVEHHEMRTQSLRVSRSRAGLRLACGPRQLTVGRHQNALQLDRFASELRRALSAVPAPAC